MEIKIAEGTSSLPIPHLLHQFSKRERENRGKLHKTRVKYGGNRAGSTIGRKMPESDKWQYSVLEGMIVHGVPDEFMFLGI